VGTLGSPWVGLSRIRGKKKAASLFVSQDLSKNLSEMIHSITQVNNRHFSIKKALNLNIKQPLSKHISDLQIKASQPRGS
jgi:hypothetical protein